MKNFRYIDDSAILLLAKEQCIGCGNCELICPHRVFRIHNGKAQITDRNSCMECGACAKNCPVNAIYVNPDDGCGCAVYIINSWINRILGRNRSGCGC